MQLTDIMVMVLLGATLAVFAGAPARLTAVVSSVLNLILGLFLVAYAQVVQPDADGFYFRTEFPILNHPEISWSTGADGMTLIMILLTALITFAAVWFTKEENNERLAYGGALLIAAGALGAFVSLDILFFFAFHELALIPTFLMIGLLGHGDRKAAAWKITIYLGLGSMILLAGLIALVATRTGDALTFNMVKLFNDTASIPDAATQGWVFLLLLLGSGILVSLFPFHSWAAPAYAAAPTPVAMLHAGVLKKFGLYALLRLALPLLPAVPQIGWIMNLLLVLLLGNILVIGLVTIAQRRFDFLLANSSVMHMGYIFLGVACFNEVGRAGATILMFAHGVGIALLFILCGHIRRKTGTLRFEDLGGLGKGAPIFMFVFALATFAAAGLPGFANFAGEVMVFLGAFKDVGEVGALQWATILALWGVVISAVYMLRAYRQMFQGPQEGTGAGLMAGGRWLVPALALLVALFVIGINPSLFTDLLRRSLEAIASSK